MISFIVPAYNEEHGLAATLKAMHAAARSLQEPYELVVADDASTDRTAAIAREQGATVVTVAHRQIAATRNAGARAACGERLIFVDADTLVNEAVVRAALQAMRSGAAGMRFDAPAPLYARLMLRVIMRGFRATGLAAGCFMFCTREAYNATGGFDERYFGAEELVMSRALKRCGRFVVLKQTVTTSARKLRTHSTREVLVMMAGMARRGTRALKQREGMDFWYAERRKDPGQGG